MPCSETHLLQIVGEFSSTDAQAVTLKAKWCVYICVIINVVHQILKGSSVSLKYSDIYSYCDSRNLL